MRSLSDDESLHERVLRAVLREAAEMDLRQSPPAMGRRIHAIVRELTGESDPYRSMKDSFNALALGLYPELRRCIETSDAPLDTAIRLAIAGNVIDAAVLTCLDKACVLEAVEGAAAAPFRGDPASFRRAFEEAHHVLYLCDNAGEIVFDRLLIEQMPFEKVTAAVRGAPTINDATMVDAEAVGLTSVVKVVDNGTDIPGTIIEECGEAFRQEFERADLVVAKGQGNYETLNEVAKDIFFALMVKCPIVARDLDCEVGDFVLKRSTVIGG